MKTSWQGVRLDTRTVSVATLTAPRGTGKFRDTPLAMTFLEAAIEILRQAGRPLSVKEITERAVTQNLLSVLGRTP